MSGTVVIKTIHNPNSATGSIGEVYVNGQHILTIRHRSIDTHVDVHDVTFDEETVKKMDSLIKAWIKENLKKK